MNETPSSHRYGYEADTPATHATALAPHHPLYQHREYSILEEEGGGELTSFQEERRTSHSERAGTSASSSLCNHFTSPYGNVRPFSSGGGVIGSPSSAFEEFKRVDYHMNNISSSNGSGRADEKTVNFQNLLADDLSVKGRETSLLISPMETPGTVRNTTSPNLSGVRTSLYGRDPTPYHSKGPATDADEKNTGSGDRLSRSGMDPPAKSPFKHLPPPHQEELSMIQEDHQESQNDASITSEVTGFTSSMPRTPVWKSVTTTPATGRSKSSTMSGSMDEKLIRIASVTRNKLDALWDTIGVQMDDRPAHIHGLIMAFESICNEKIEEEEGLANQFRKDIDDLKAEYEASCVALGLENEIQRRDPSGKEMMSLQCEYEAVFGRVESVRGAVAVAKEDLMGSQERVFEAFRALNGEEGEELEEWRDVETDLTERRRAEFRAKAVELEEAVASRTRAIVSLTRDCQNLLRDMDIVVDGNAFGDEVVGNNEDDVKIMNSLVLQADESVQSPHDHRSRSSDRFDIVSLFETQTCMGISSSALERLTRRIAELNDEKKRRRNILAKMGASIQALWIMLRVPEEEQKAFSNTIRMLSLETIRRGEKELARLNERKAVMIGKLIKEKRQEIEKLWEQTNATDAEKADFDAHFYVYEEDKLTEELLTTHQEYASILNEKLEKMRPILDLIAKREAIVSERFELEQLQKDPERLKGRHACQQLAKEEKMHRRVKNELPRITNHLEKTLQKWYNDNKPASEEQREADPTLGHFLYQGAPYLETIHTQEHDWKMRKEIEEQDRKNKRDEERKSKHNTFGSSYSKLPGQKYKPSIGSTTSSSTAGSRRAESRPRSASNVRAASNPRGGPRAGPSRALADVSGSRGNVPRPPSRSRQGIDKPAASRNNIPGHRTASAPRQRF